ncbi:MAG: hypothetical protein V1663_03355 [archaeon]
MSIKYRCDTGIFEVSIIFKSNGLSENELEEKCKSELEKEFERNLKIHFKKEFKKVNVLKDTKVVDIQPHCDDDHFYATLSAQVEYNIRENSLIRPEPVISSNYPMNINSVRIPVDQSYSQRDGFGGF